MKCIKYLLICSLSILFLINCGESSSTEEKAQSKASVEETKKETKTNASGPWQINKEMIASIRHMELLTQSFGGRSIEDFNALGVELTKDCQSLIDNCKMEDKALKEFENWSGSFMESVKTMGATADRGEGKRMYLKVSEDIKQFSKIFNSK